MNRFNRRLKMTVMNGIFFTILMFLSKGVFADNQPLQQLSSRLQSYTTYVAQFTQKTYDTSGRRIQSNRGTMMLKRPNQFRWETFEPTHQLVISNGKTLWNYDADLMQATHQPVSVGNNNPAALLNGDANQLQNQYTVTSKNCGSSVCFSLKAKKSNAPIFGALIQFNRAIMTSLTIQNNLNQTSVFEFTKISVNKNIDTAQFNFVPPKGVELLNPS